MLIDELYHERMRASREHELRVEVERQRVIFEREADGVEDPRANGRLNSSAATYSISA